MFQKFQNKNQTQYLAQTWQKALQKREIQRNNYRATGDIKKAKAFVKMVENFTFRTDFPEFAEAIEQAIFPGDPLVIPLQPAYLLTSLVT